MVTERDRERGVIKSERERKERRREEGGKGWES